MAIWSLATRPGGRRGVATLAILGTCATVFGGAVAAAPEARAEAAEGGPGYMVADSAGTGVSHWAGPFVGPNGTRAYCMEAGKISSAPNTNFTEYNNPQLSAVFSLYDGVNTAESNAAIAYLVHQHADTGPDAARWLADVGAAHPSVVALANQYWAEAAQYANGVDITADNPVTTDKGRTFTVNNIRAGSTNADVTVSINGPATFEDGSKTTTVSAGGSVKLIATGNGEATLNFSATGLPGTGPLLTYQEASHLQRMMITGGGTSDASGYVSVVGLRAQFQPKITSQVVSEFISEGEVATDNLNVNLDDSIPNNDTWLPDDTGADATVTFKGTLYGPYESPQTPSKEVPAGAPVVAERTITANGEGSFSAGADVRVEKSGYYTWVWELVQADQPAATQKLLFGDYSDGFFTEGETTITRMKPEIVTEVDSQIIDANDPLIDKVTLSLTDGAKWITDKSGNPVSLTAKGTAYGPFLQPVEETSEIPADAPVAGTETITFDGTGTKTTSGSVKAQGEGFYTWVWEIDEGQYNDGFKTNYMIFNETNTERWELKHSSETREYNVVQGGRAFDTIDIDNFPKDHTQFQGTKSGWKPDLKTAQVTVYGPMKEEPSTKEIPADAPIFKQFNVDAVNGKYRIGYDDATKVEIPKGNEYSGYYVFVYSFDGDDRVTPFHSDFNDLLERFYVPGDKGGEDFVKVATQATKEAKTGEPFSDTALVTASNDDTQLKDKGSYLEFNAYLDKTDDGVAQCETPFFTSEKIPVSKSGYYNSGDTTVDEAGKVYWIETLYDKDGNVLSKGDCGIESETTTITQTPNLEVTTQATETIEVGEKAHDTAIVTGTMPEGGVNLSFDLYEGKKNEAGEYVCEPENKVFSTNYGHIDKVGSYESEEVTLSKPGDYYWVETVTDNDGNVIHRGECGLPNETTTVKEKPTKPETPGKKLAKTGADALPFIIGGVGLAGVGAGALFLLKRRGKGAEAPTADVTTEA